MMIDLMTLITMQWYLYHLSRVLMKRARAIVSLVPCLWSFEISMECNQSLWMPDEP